jgi:hypothetical protein
VHCAEPLYGDDELAFSRAHRLADAPEDDVLTFHGMEGRRFDPDQVHDFQLLADTLLFSLVSFSLAVGLAYVCCLDCGESCPARCSA